MPSKSLTWKCCQLLLSGSGSPGILALPANIAREAEPLFAKSGIFVCSNASAFRREPDVPILLPEANAEQTAVLKSQQQNHGWSGAIVTNSNCTSTGVTVMLKVLLQAFGLNKVFAVSMQALSGAGYPGVPSMDIVDNVIPYVDNEEGKVESEPLKMLGTVQDGVIRPANFKISAHTNRVQVTDGTPCACRSNWAGAPASKRSPRPAFLPCARSQPFAAFGPPPGRPGPFRADRHNRASTGCPAAV